MCHCNNIIMKPHYYPVLAFVIAGIAYIYCITYAITQKIYIGGIIWPFFSDTGRDKPNYYIFASALSISGILLMITYYYMYCLIKELNSSSSCVTGVSVDDVSVITTKRNNNNNNNSNNNNSDSNNSGGAGAGAVAIAVSSSDLQQQQQQRKQHDDDTEEQHIDDQRAMVSKSLIIYAYLGTFFGFFIGPFMAMTGIFDDIHSPHFHFTGAYGTFVCILLNMIFYTITFRMLSILQPKDMKLKFSYHLKLFLMIVLGICFILYVPVGEVIRCSPRRLTMEKCIHEQGLGTEYCHDLQMPPAADGSWSESGSTGRIGIEGIENDVTDDTYLWDYTTCTWAYSWSAILQCICVVTGYLYCVTISLDLKKDSVLFMKTMYENMDDSMIVSRSKNNINSFSMA